MVTTCYIIILSIQSNTNTGLPYGPNSCITHCLLYRPCSCITHYSLVRISQVAYPTIHNQPTLTPNNTHTKNTWYFKRINTKYISYLDTKYTTTYVNEPNWFRLRNIMDRDWLLKADLRFGLRCCNFRLIIWDALTLNVKVQGGPYYQSIYYVINVYKVKQVRFV